MTMTYEPFTPAGSDEQRRYDGRRRAEEPPAGDPGRWGAPAADPWAESARDQRWSEPVPADPWDEPAGGVRPRSAPPAGPQQRAEEVHWQPADPLHNPRHTGEQPAWRTGEQPAWHTGLSPAIEPEPQPEPRRAAPGGSRVKPFVIGVVALLLLVAGWQAYRIESMTQHSQELASVLSTEKNRTDRLEKQLAGVFDPEAVSSGVLPSVFRVRAGGFTGTAFSVGKKASGGQSNLITNYHVVAEIWTDGGSKVTLERGSTRINATIVKVDKAKDLALLRANQRIAGLGTSTAQVKPGQQVVVVGAPLGLDDSVTTGVISAYRPDDPDGPTVQFDAPINPGNSGGPVVNANEQVVGVATAKAKDAEGIGLAIPIKTACDTFDVC
ncbi:MAG TPA: trypsin-like peptidase domain-containing protein [Actinoplanes sp.]|nr:trypsin-like peptidase domain-containing protein [Actinoplanes sp.]